MVKHIIDGITTLCGRSLNDKNWPVDHNWVSPGHNEESTCAKCRAAAGLHVTSDHFLDQIESIYAFVGVENGSEGIIGLPIGPAGEMMPLIAADVARMNDFVPFVRKMPAVSRMDIRLVQFTTRKVLEEYKQ